MDLETSVIRVLKIIKMANIIDIPSKSYQTYFGEVKKCVWFEVTDNYNYFSVIHVKVYPPWSNIIVTDY